MKDLAQKKSGLDEVSDEIFCLSVIEEYIDTNHYYDTQDVPPHDLVIKIIDQRIAHSQ